MMDRGLTAGIRKWRSDLVIEAPNFRHFVLLFVALWLAVDTVLSLLSGWFWLMIKFPDQPAEPILRVRGQSGSMGLGVACQGILTLSVCSSGLRVGIMRAFGPFCRNFFVPWESLTVTRTTFLFWPRAKLRFGKPVIGRLTISGGLANRLARATMGRWPEAGPFPKEQRRAVFRRLLIEWAALTCFAAFFFLFAQPRGDSLPISVAILFPAIVFGVAFLVEFITSKD